VKIQSIVEGQGEVEALPVLLRRLLSEAHRHEVEIDRPIRRTQAQLRNKEDVQAAMRLAMRQPQCAAVLFLFDGEDDCPAELGRRVCAWASEAAAGRVPCATVVAYREYETWFLASLESLRGKHGIRDDAAAPANPESHRDAKGALEAFMPANHSYSETYHQAKLSAALDLRLAAERSRSFRKLVKAIDDLLSQMRGEQDTFSAPGL